MLNAAGIIFRAPSGRVLLLKRTDGFWDYPGGGAIGDETAEHTALRETVEETRYYPGYVGRFHARRVRNGVDYTTFLRDCEDEFTPRLSDEHTDWAWIDPKVALGESIKARADDAPWDEADHPRDESGQFTGAGGHASAARGKDGSLTTTSGEALPEHIARLKVPPAWTDVTYAEDPGAALLVTGKDAKGRRVSIYSELHNQQAAAAKFARVSELDQKFQLVAKQNAALGKDPAKRDVTDCLGLIMAMGIRPGSDRDTKAKVKAYGATTLEGQHVVEEGGQTFLRYTGKKGVNLNLPVPAAWAKALQERAKKAGPNGRLFGSVNETQLLEHVHSLDGGGFKTKDFRTHLGTSTASELVEKMDVPKTQQEYRKAVMEVAKKVSSVLGNTPVIALQSYINPSVFASWKAAA